jgi:hypothetical protein
MSKLARLTVLFLGMANVVRGQEMEPRTYSPAPTGAQFVLVSYGYQSGDVLFDGSLPLKDVSAKLDAATLGYGRTFSLAGRQANVAVLVPYLWSRVEGAVFEQHPKIRRSGGGDLRVRFSTLLKGGPALSPKEFAKRKPGAVIGASVTVVVPTGQYDPQRLVNLGSNRWAFKPEIGISKPKARWTFEVMGGVWFFGPNNSFLGQSRRTQDPIAAFQGAVIYTLRRRMWLSGNATFYTGGATVLNGTTNEDLQRNSRVGATFSAPLTQKQSLKVAWAKGVTTRIGGNINNVVFGWQYVWF